MQVSMNRRLFIKFIGIFSMAASTGAIFSCSSHEKPSVSKSGLIDVHHHILPPDCIAALKRFGMTTAGGVDFPDWSTQTSLSVMDQNEITAAITSMPYLYSADISLSRDLMRHCNEYSARLISDYPKRFGSLAVLPLPDVEAALQELEYALDHLNLDGIVLPTNVGGHYLGDPVFDELFSELNRRKAVVFIHPIDPPGECLTTLKLPTSLIEFVFDTTRAITNLIYSGTLERCPDIRFIVSHAGGAVPYLSWRISLFQHKAGMQEKVPKGVMTYLKRLYYDTALSAAPNALRSLQELVYPSQILFGSDYPFALEVLTTLTIRDLKNYRGFDKQALKAIEHENALKLFPRIGKG
jgi:predicted TIM-barrel fold metal-dependent hydrolase